MDSYVSPYGFGPVTDMMLDAITERRGITVDELSSRLHSNPKTEWSGEDGIYDALERRAWDEIIGPAIDQIEDAIFGEEPHR